MILIEECRCNWGFSFYLLAMLLYIEQSSIALMRDKEKIHEALVFIKGRNKQTKKLTNAAIIYSNRAWHWWGIKSEDFVFLLKLFRIPAKYNVIIILLIKHIFHGWSYVQCRYLTDSKDVYFPAFLSLIYIYFIYSYIYSYMCCFYCNQGSWMGLWFLCFIHFISTAKRCS